MPFKPIIEIQVDDANWKSFYEMFQRFLGETKELPENWKRASEAFGNSSHKTAEAAAAIHGHLNRATNAQHGFVRAIQAGNRGLTHMASLSLRIAGAFGSIAKFAAGLVGLGIGGLFALDKLSQSTMGTAGQARGAGLTFGQQRAFGNVFRDVLPPSMPQTIANNRLNPMDRANMAAAMGLTQGQLEGESVAQLALRARQRARDWFIAHHGDSRAMATNNPFMQGFALSGIDYQTMGKIAGIPAGEFGRQTAAFIKESKEMQIGNKALSQLRDFDRILHEAGMSIDTAFIKGLAPLGPLLAKDVRALASFSDVLIGKLLSPAHMAEVNKALNQFLVFLQSPAAKKDFDDFLAKMRKLGDAVMHIASLIDNTYKMFHVSVTHEKNPRALNPLANGPGGLIHELKPSNWADDIKNHSLAGRFWEDIHKVFSVHAERQGKDVMAMARIINPRGLTAGSDDALVLPGDRLNVNDPAWKASIAKADKLLGLPGFLEKQIAMESGGKINAYNATTGATGIFQDLLSIAKKLGFDPRKPFEALAGNLALSMSNANVLGAYYQRADAKTRREMLNAAHHEGVTLELKQLKAAHGDFSKALESMGPKTQAYVRKGDERELDALQRIAKATTDTARLLANRKPLVVTVPVAGKLATQLNAAH